MPGFIAVDGYGQGYGPPDLGYGEGCRQQGYQPGRENYLHLMAAAMPL
ncbi:MAG: hypothetical protein WBL87_06265 [Methanothrix sp.]